MSREAEYREAFQVTCCTRVLMFRPVLQPMLAVSGVKAVGLGGQRKSIGLSCVLLAAL